jgi:hypothetical protein
MKPRVLTSFEPNTIPFKITTNLVDGAAASGDTQSIVVVVVVGAVVWRPQFCVEGD